MPLTDAVCRIPFDPLNVFVIWQNQGLGDGNKEWVTVAELASFQLPNHRAKWQEFAYSRWLLHTYCNKHHSFPRNPYSGPPWPKGVCGSIAHRHGAVAVAFGKSSDQQACGVDLEVVSAATERVWSWHDSSDEENLLQEQAPAFSKAILATLSFSFKESLYKAFCNFDPSIVSLRDFSILDLQPKEGEIVAIIRHRPEKKMTGRFFFNADRSKVLTVFAGNV